MCHNVGHRYFSFNSTVMFAKQNSQKLSLKCVLGTMEDMQNLSRFKRWLKTYYIILLFILACYN